ncbi:MAG: DegT/DnrJ/EryC1/StrS family aminotransferase [Burkholderiaceae bacterium]
MTNNDFLPFALPEIGEEEIAEVCDALRSGWVTTGPKTRQFEKDFAAYLGIESEAIAVNSATAGLHLALEAIGIQPGDEVITTTLTFTATGEVIRYLGAHPVFVDVNPVTLNIDVDAIRRAITPRTRAILPVHYGGLACDMDAIIRLAREHGLKVVEDAAHAFPTRYKGRLVGTLDTDVTVFSFYANKTMTTGEGGMIVARDPALVQRMKVMRLHGISRDAFDRFTSRTPAWYYEVIAPGFKYNLTDIASALGIHQLRKIDRFLLRRQQLARRYFEQLADLPLILPADANAQDGSAHSWHLFVVRLRESVRIERNAVIEELSKRGVGTSVHYIPLHRQPYWKETYSLSEEQFPVADQAYQSMISIPLYTKMSNADLDRVVNALRNILS